VQRDFSSRGINQLLVADITEFKTLEGKLYLAGVKDLGSNAIVGWSMSNRQTTELVINAVVMAVERRNLDGKVVHHSDRGCQYTSFGFTQRLSDLGLVQSFGSTGDCYDNAAMESFWATLKREMQHIHGIVVWPTRAALKTAIFDYIEVFYNRQRNQERLGHLPPAIYEDKLLTA
jgi:transposase InsO family protein